MSADSSPSHEPISLPRVPNRARRSFHPWQAVVVILVVGLIALSLALLQPFASPHDKLMRNWKQNRPVSAGDNMILTPLWGIFLLSFTSDGKMIDMQKLDVNGNIASDGYLSTYTWLNDTTILIHPIDRGYRYQDEKATVRFDGWGPWLELTLIEEGTTLEESYFR